MIDWAGIATWLEVERQKRDPDLRGWNFDYDVHWQSVHIMYGARVAESLDNFARCLREASMLAELERRMRALVSRVRPRPVVYK